MTGLLTKVDRPLIRGQGRFDPNLALDLPFVPSASIQPFRGKATTFSRSSVAYCFDSIGVLRQMLADVPCFGHDPANNFAPLGLRIEGQAINEIRNNMMAGAAAATDTLPNNWVVETAGGLSVDVTDAGTEDGMEYLEIRLNGTPVGDIVLDMEAAGIIGAAQNEIWTVTAYAKMTGGSAANINGLKLRFREYDNTVALLVTGGGSTFAPTSAIQRIAYTRTMLDAATAFIKPQFYVDWDGSGAIDITLRIYLPQCEKNLFATSPIKTASFAGTRNAGILTSTFTGFPSAGALVCLARAPGGSNAADATLFHAEASSSSNKLQIWRRSNDNPRVKYRTAGGATSTVDIATAWADDTDMRIAVGWDKDRVQMSLDQTTPTEATHTGVVFDEAPNALSFGHDKALTAHLGGHLRWFRLYNTPFFGAALQAL